MPARRSTGPRSPRRGCSRSGAAAWCCSGTQPSSPPPPCSLHSGAMSPRKPAVLRGDGQNLREYLIVTAARMIDERGSAGLSVLDIAREAQVADGVLYNYFEDKEDLLAHALLAHVGTMMASAPPLLPPPGEGTVAENLRVFIDGGIANLLRVTPAFAGLISQPKVLTRFHA